MADSSLIINVHLRKTEEDLLAANALVQAELWGAAVNRSYYAMYHGASALMAREGVQFREHGKLMAALGVILVKSGRFSKRYHKMLYEAFSDRQTADYSTLGMTDKDTAIQSVAMAHEFAMSNWWRRPSAKSNPLTTGNR